MKTTLCAALLATAMVLTPALAQDVNGISGATGNPPAFPLNPPETLNPGPDQPSPLTGELVPLPGPPPEGEAAKIKLPDCAPPNCGVPQIMAE
ncbi:hypothetical protein ACO2RV_17780 [Ancylobacter sp. VNQ12]|uniref:hypothetical protein n=1 Tax=Ancylobacter sp. VNQ12 TaxID=3400920 RepID=UPI003C06D9BB